MATDRSRLALVTGASSGIGQAYARRLGREGFDLIVVGRRQDRLVALSEELADVDVRPIVADLGTDDGIEKVAELCAREEISMLINDAGVSHYMAFAQLPAAKASEVIHVKVMATTMLARAAVPGMVGRGSGKIVNVAGMLGFGAEAPLGRSAGRATYVGTLAHIIAFSQALHEELNSHGVQVQVLCPGVVATEFHERQGMDLSAVPRMSAEDVVTASLMGLSMREIVCAPGVEDMHLFDAVTSSNLAAFAGQSPNLAARYRST